MLSRRIDLFLSLPLEKLDNLAIKHELDGIGKTKDASGDGDTVAKSPAPTKG
jgi:hypothetical protein